MIRVISLIAVILLAGCTTTMQGPATPQIAGIGSVSLSMYDFPDAPNRVQDTFYSTFATAAPLRGIAFNPGLDGTVRVRGYLSVAGSASGTLLIYVFDFEDSAGNRLTRIGGQTSTHSAPNDPWDAVDYTLARGVVDDVLDQFRAWIDDNNVGV